MPHDPPATADAGSAIARLAAAGRPLVEGLEAYGRELPAFGGRRWFKRLSRTLASGVPLDEAIARISSSGSDYLGAVLRAGVETAQLARLLDQHLLARQRARDIRLGLWLSAAYPLTLMAVAVVVLTAILLWFAPVMKDLVSSFAVTLPEPTRAIFAASDLVWTLIPYWPYGPVLLAVLFAGLWCLKFVPGRAARVRLWQKVPVIGTAARNVGLSEFCGLLAVLAECRVPLPQALRLTADALGDANLAEGSRRLAEQCERGLPPDREIVYMPHFPASLAPIFRWDDHSEAFVRGLHAASEVYAAEAQVQSWVAGALIQPLGLALVVLLVGGVMLMLYLPLFELLKSLT